jgi:hypothetical protein
VVGFKALIKFFFYVLRQFDLIRQYSDAVPYVFNELYAFCDAKFGDV